MTNYPGINDIISKDYYNYLLQVDVVFWVFIKFGPCNFLIYLLSCEFGTVIGLEIYQWSVHGTDSATAGDTLAVISFS